MRVLFCFLILINLSYAQNHHSVAIDPKELIGKWQSVNQKITIDFLDPYLLSIKQSDLIPSENQGIWFLSPDQKCISYSYIGYYFPCFLRITRESQRIKIFFQNLVFEKN
jgi:hypothetical protein